MGRKRIDTILEGLEATQEFAAAFASTLVPNDLILLYGDLGAGKTTFMQGLIYGLGNKKIIVQSPTFVYLHIYPTPTPVYHFDLYRLKSSSDFLAMGFDEYFEKGGITAIEWPERIASIIPPTSIRIELSTISETARRLVIA